MIKAETKTSWKTGDGSWNRSAIMSRGHELAQSMDDDRDYSDRLSIGMKRAWQEAKQAERETQEAKIEEKREGFRERLENWREERKGYSSPKFPSAFPTDHSDEILNEEVQVGRWQITAYPDWKEKPTIHFKDTVGGGEDEVGEEGVTTFTFSSATKQRAAMKWAKRRAGDFDDLRLLTEWMHVSICPETKDCGTKSIAYGRERHPPESEEHLDHYICN